MRSSSRSAQVVHQPAVHQAFLAGVRKLALAIQPTIGPGSRPVAIAAESGKGGPELLDSGGLIARRLLELPDRREDVGAMFLRNMLWRVHSATADGTATTSVIFLAALEGGLRYLAAGGNAMMLREQLQRDLQVALQHLDQQVRPMQDLEEMRRFAFTMCLDQQLAEVMADVYHLLGDHGRVEVRKSRRREIESDQIEGSWWEGAVHSPQFLFNRDQRRVDLPHCHVLVSDLDLEDPAELVSLMERARGEGVARLMLVVNSLSPACISTVLANRQAGQFEVIAVKTPGVSAGDRADVLADLAVVSGAEPLRRTTGDRVGTCDVSRLGRARRIWADRTHFGMIGGAGEPELRRAAIRNLENAFAAATDDDVRQRLSARIGNLYARSAVVRIGDVQESRMQTRMDQATQLGKVIRLAMVGGTVPGGGMALHALRDAVPPLDAGADADARAARIIMRQALAAPVSQILENLGHHAPVVLGNQERLAAVISPELRDAAVTVKTALRVAIEGAAQALTIDTVIHHRNPEESIHP